MSDLKVYVVTLHRHEDLEGFYEDMENPGGDLYIPNRQVDVHALRPLSRSTEYHLTDEEAATLRHDSRVLDVTPKEMLINRFKPLYTQTETTWNKNFTDTNSHKNWGLLRVFEGQQRSGWGEDGTVNQSGTIKITAEGKNVDVIIVDGHFDPAHPEYAVNSDGTGGSRVIQYNWYQHNLAVSGGLYSNGNYVYGPYFVSGDAGLNSDNNHGAHVAGTVAGNTQGWARKANIYNISPYGTNPNLLVGTYLYDYIKEFHKNKPINPVTGRKNPTIMNCSYGSAIEWGISPFGKITRVTYRGQIIENASGLTVQQLQNTKIYTSNQFPYVPYYYPGDAQDIQDLLDLGVIIVAAAGNESFYMANFDHPDWDNSFRATYNGGSIGDQYQHRGSAPAALKTVISVGAVGNTADERKAYFSNCGSGVDIFAPGRAIMSALNSGGTTDPRNANYRIGKNQGTSMASPQVAGMLACYLEIYPDINQDQAREFLIRISKKDQMTNTGDKTYTWGVTNSGTTGYSFTGYTAGTDIPITVSEGTILEFNVSAVGHPFWIKTSQTTGTANGVTTGIITNNGTDNGKIIWDTQGVLPGTYYYICQNHSAMTGVITITASTMDDANMLRSPNRYLTYQTVRDDNGTTFPKKAYFFRPDSGSVYPRYKKRIRG